MRKILNINDNWKFVKHNIGIHASMEAGIGETINLPHTWNAVDGQDGGNDYHRGTCWYIKQLEIHKNCDEEIYLEFQAVNSVADVYINGHHLAHHEGGYSAFRVNLTDALKEENILCVSVDNSAGETIYPQKADFTFYGGIYRDVNLIRVSKTHFALDYNGAPGIKISPLVSTSLAKVTMEAWVTHAKNGDNVRFRIDGVTESCAVVTDGKAQTVLEIPNPHLWNGVEDPYLYTAIAVCGDDEISAKFGCRQFHIDKNLGFFLNGNVYPLRGVSRHQDRKYIGNAVTPEMMEEDMSIILEMGANTIRLAHYQHSQYFYDLCDRYGLVVWVEIPYITCHMSGGRENTISQMTELVCQNYNHPSIICWGMSNEITAHGGVSQELTDNHHQLNELCHKLDATRPTAMAHVFMLDMSEGLVMLPDLLSYNLYYGWYLGELEDNDKWFDDFRRQYPEVPVGLSEYGADAVLKYQTNNPQKGDYTEQYQALYHEHMLSMLAERPYIWASHVWNMFDFGADGRNEGGENGVNHKGIVSFDRKIKKDAFYIYKAYLSKDPFVHICGRRYVDRHEDITAIKIYSNQEEVTLFVDEQKQEGKKGNYVFEFNVRISGEHRIEAWSGEVKDSIQIRKTSEPNQEYILMDQEVINWFQKEGMGSPEGCYSIQDRIGDIKNTPEGAGIMEKFMAAVSATRGDVAVGTKRTADMEKMMNNTTVKDAIKKAGSSIGEKFVLEVNQALNKIKKSGSMEDGKEESR